jgi:hypothetical protein
MSGVTPGSSQASAPRAPTVPTEEPQHRGKFVQKPNTFDGSRKFLDDWLLKLDLFFMFEDIPNDKQVSLAATYMTGDAFKWIKPYLKQFLNTDDEENENSPWMNDFDLFKDKIQTIFGLANEAMDAERAIQQLRQRGAAADYAAEFQQYAVLTKWDNTALMTMYRQGLKLSVRAELMRCGAEINTLAELIDMSIEYDNKLYELNRETRSARAPAPAVGRTNKFIRKPVAQRTTYYATPHRPSRPARNWHDPDAMDLSNLNRGKKSNGKPGRQTSSEERLCYGCGKPGHIARNCRAKKPAKGLMLNVLTGPQSDTEEEWDTCDVLPSIETEGDITKIELHDAFHQLKIDMGPDSPASDSEYHSVSEEEPPRKKTKHTRTLRERAPTPHPEFRIADETSEEFKFYQELRDEIDTDYDLIWESIVKEVRELGEMDPNIQLNLIKGLIKTHQEHKDEAVNGLKKIFMDGQLAPLVAKDFPYRYSSRKGEGFRCTNKENDILAHLYKAQNDYHDRAILRLQQDSWLEKAKAEGKAYRESIDGPDPKPVLVTNKYTMDYRNSRHGELSAHHCVHPTCTIHYSDKYGTGYWPKAYGTCVQMWYDCGNDTCADHLWDKRSRAHFPGTEDPAATLRMRMLVNDVCSQADWQTCLHPGCLTHMDIKEFYGFGEKGPQPFLDLRSVANNAALQTPQR